MNWIARLFKHDDVTPDLESAKAQLDDAQQQLAESREIADQTRKRLRENHITEGFAAAFEGWRHA